MAKTRRGLALLAIIVALVLMVFIAATDRLGLDQLAAIATLLVVPPTIIASWLAWAAYRQAAKPPRQGEANRDKSSRNRALMIERVRVTWIKGLLKRSAHGAVPVKLGLSEEPGLVEHPLHLMLRDVPGRRDERELPAGTSITDAYQDSGGALLILGEPGAGKTTLLLELAHNLLTSAAVDDTLPIPVVFTLSTWAARQPAFGTWLLEELNCRYLVPRRLAQSWLDNGQILPLLDGLDEVAPAYRAGCVRAINLYRQQHGMMHMAICSRTAEYRQQAARLTMQGAVSIQALTARQVDDCLSSAGGQFESLRALLRRDEALREVAASPLMLNVLMLAYHDRPANDLLELEPAAIRQRLMSKYVDRMFQRHRSTDSLFRKSAVRRLEWLASTMAAHNETEFRIERIQLDWVPHRLRNHMFPSFAVGIVLGLFGWLIYTLFFLTHFDVATSVFFGLCVGLSSTGIYGLFNGLLMERARRFADHPPRLRSQPAAPDSLWTRFVKSRAAYGLIFGLSIGPLVGVFMGSRLGAAAGVGYAVYNSLVLTIDFILLGRLDSKVQSAETVTWSTAAARRAIVRLGWIAGGIGLTASLFFASDASGARMAVLGVVFGLVNIGITALLGGITYERLDNSRFENSNEGIRRSLRYGLLFGAFGGLVVGLTVGLTLGLLVDPKAGASAGLFSAISAAEIIGLRAGGFAWFHHMSIRFLLWRCKCIPWNYVRFLNQAVDLNLLQRVGGGYMFSHRLLLEHFATTRHATLPPARRAIPSRDRRARRDS